MDLRHHVDSLQQQYLAAAKARGEQAHDLAADLIDALTSAIRLTLLEALSDAADEITRELAPGSVEVRLRGLEPSFVVTQPPGEQAAPHGATEAPPDDGPTARINFRPPEGLKNRIDEAAAREGLSVNAWLVRTTGAALTDQPRRPGTTGERHHLGWVR